MHHPLHPWSAVLTGASCKEPGCQIFGSLPAFLPPSISFGHLERCHDAHMPRCRAGLLLYAADLALRSGQLMNTTLVTGASVDDQSGVATLQLKTSKVGYA